jgi:hypothetical protein
MVRLAQLVVCICVFIIRDLEGDEGCDYDVFVVCPPASRSRMMVSLAQLVVFFFFPFYGQVL